MRGVSAPAKLGAVPRTAAARRTGPSRVVVVGGVGAIGAITCVLSAAGSGSPIRTAAALAFLLLGPGLVIGELLELADTALRVSVAFAGSVAVDTLVAVVLIYGDWYSGGTGLAIIFGLTIVGALVVLRSERWRNS